MPFGVKNGPSTYQRAITKAFREYIDVFMKIFLDDFTIFSDMSTHLKKFKKCFLKCKEYEINLNLEKCAFMVCSGIILRFIVSKEGKTHDPKKIKTLVKVQMPETPREIQVFNGMTQFYKCVIIFFAFIMAPITKLLIKAKILNGSLNVKLLGKIYKKIHSSCYTYQS
jgi:hypothetical protein